MTIPEDVRDIIRTTLEYYVEYWDENDTSMDNRYSTDAHADAEIVYAWLDAQPEAPERWEPAKHGFRFSQTDEDGDITLIVVDNLLGYPPKLLISIHGVLGLVELPDNLRLFCCTEATG